jgi:hypothetical protein
MLSEIAELLCFFQNHVELRVAFNISSYGNVGSCLCCRLYVVIKPVLLPMDIKEPCAFELGMPNVSQVRVPGAWTPASARRQSDYIFSMGDEFKNGHLLNITVDLPKAPAAYR